MFGFVPTLQQPEPEIEKTKQAHAPLIAPPSFICLYFSSQIRRRQRKAFLSANSEHGLYFTPRLYDGFMSLLQKAKATALAAEAGYYDDNKSNEGGGNDKTTATESAEEQQMQQHLSLGVDGGRRSNKVNSAAAAVPSITPTQKMKNKNEEDLEDGSGDGERSSCSTHPASDRSLGGYGDEDANDDTRRTGGDTRGISHGGYRSDVLEQGRGEGKGTVDGNATFQAGSNSHTPVERVLEELTPGGDLEARQEAGGCEARSTTEGFGLNNNNEDERESSERLGTLRDMLQRLDCEEWDGAVNTVLNVIEGLSSWVPPPASLDESPLAQNNHNGAGPGIDENSLSLGVDALLASDDGADDQEASSRDGGRGEEDDPKREDDDDDEDKEEQEGEEEEEGGTDTDAESKGEDEDDYDNYYSEKEEEEEKRHPLLREQKALRAQWRRLVLDAQLEPETDCSAFMREEAGIMIDGIIDAMEAVRRETGRAVGGEGTPRGNILGYDEVRFYT